jgi:hypothetical protein
VLIYNSRSIKASTKPSEGTLVSGHRVFVLERIEREYRDLVDWEGLAWGGPLPLIGLA